MLVTPVGDVIDAEQEQALTSVSFYESRTYITNVQHVQRISS